jgi:hypothetical protein
MITLALFLIVFESVYESLADSGRKTIAGVIEFIYRAGITTIAFLWLADIQVFQVQYENIYYIIGGFILLRFAIFDVIYNLIVGNPIFKIGTTKLYDKIWNKFFAWSKFPKEHFLAMVKFLSLIVGLTWLITK